MTLSFRVADRRGRPLEKETELLQSVGLGAGKQAGRALVRSSPIPSMASETLQTAGLVTFGDGNAEGSRLAASLSFLSGLGPAPPLMPQKEELRCDEGSVARGGEQWTRVSRL
jgi:hypothetical protein